MTTAVRVVQAPKVGSVWRHYKGNLYRVVSVGRMEATGAWVVGYANSSSLDHVFYRPLEDWYASLPSGGVRFSPIALDAERYIEPYGDESKWRKA